ncbi:MAG TPA: c-type cytochrome [Nitrospiria bacterium]|nr:c-type cytochrome [Candidatus Manganitrophaceae bacterium]HIL34040.1 c-type cytochrome [Candidatus Manganitrophaceae bacterium]
MSNLLIKRTGYIFLLLVTFGLGLGDFVYADEEDGSASQSAEEEDLPGDDMAAGKKIYEKRCISCHGIEGDGDGPAADLFQPKPRSFKKGEFKYRTTPRGDMPTDDDLFKVVTHGLPGTGMPDWADILNEKKRRQVIKYIKTFSTKWDEQTEAPHVVTVGELIPSSAESIDRGKKQFTSLGCTICHGAEGRGDGPTALFLKNHRGDPVYPRNLNKNWLFRGGGEAKDIYMRVNTGINGTPMPSFAAKLDNEKSWDLANFVRSLSPDKKPEGGSLIKARLIEGAIPTDPNDPLWEETEENWFPMMGQISFKTRLFKPTVTDITVKSLFNETEIGFMLKWDDRSKSKASKAGAKITTYTDQVAIQFPEHLQPGGVKKPYFIMGDEKLGVNLWNWVSEGDRLVETNANGVWNNSEVAQEGLDISGQGVFKDGQYRVVMKRALQTADKEKDIQFEVGVFYPIAFFAMDGTNGETDSRRSITPWYFIFMEPEIDKTIYFYPPVVVVFVFGIQFVLVKWLKKNYKKSGKG